MAGLLTIALAMPLALRAETAPSPTKETTMTQTPRHWCIGRFALDLPAEFTPVEIGHSFGTTRVERLGQGSDQDLRRLIDARGDAVGRGLVQDDQGVTLRLVSRDPLEGMPGLVLAEVADDPVFATDTTRREVYALRRGQMMRATGDIVVNEAGDLRRETTATLAHVATGMQPLDEDEMPGAASSCILGAQVVAPVDAETVSFAFKTAAEDNMALEITLVQRGEGQPAPAQEPPSHPAATNRTVAGFPGTELRQRGETEWVAGEAIRFVYVGGTPAGTPDGQGGVSIRISLEKWGNDLDGAPYDEPAMAALWDGALSSLRQRR